jgi:hypothetical protein
VATKEDRWKNVVIDVPTKKMQVVEKESEESDNEDEDPLAPFVCMCRVFEEQPFNDPDRDGSDDDDSWEYEDMPPLILREDLDFDSDDDSDDDNEDDDTAIFRPDNPLLREFQRRASYADDLLLSQFDEDLADVLSRETPPEAFGEIFETFDISEGFVGLRISNEGLERWRNRMGQEQGEQNSQEASFEWHEEHPTREEDNVFSLVQVASTVNNAHVLEALAMRSIPCSIDNALPHIAFEIVKGIYMMALVDSCAGVSTGNYSFHKHVMSNLPPESYKLTHFDGDEPFECLYLRGAIEKIRADDKEGRLFAVVEYNTTYSTMEGESVKFAFALGHDVAVKAIMGCQRSRA